MKILIADDEQLELQALAHIIESSSFNFDKIITAKNGIEAKDKAIEEKADICILDIKMPGLSGLDASDIIRKELPDTKIIFLTAFNYFDYAKKAIKLKANDYIIKPASRAQLTDALSSAIEQIEKESSDRSLLNSSKQQLETMSKYMQSELITLLYINEMSTEEIKSSFEMLNINIKNGFCMVLNSSIINNSNKDYLNKIIYNYLSNKYETVLLNIINNEIYILLKTDDMKNYLDLKFFNKIILKLEDEFQHPFYLGISDIFKEYNQIYKSFMQASYLCTPQISSERVRTSEQITDKLNQQFEMDLMEREQKICEYILLNTTEKAKNLSDSTIDNIYFNNENNLEAFHQKTYEFLLSIIKTVIKEQSLNDYYNSLSLYIIKEKKYPISIKHFAAMQLMNLSEAVNRKRTVNNDNPINNICDYIDKNYMENISLEDAADKVGFSIYYFSKLFKETMNVNFIEYLNNVRIEQAKKLLRETDYSVKKISFMVGFNNPSYFSTNFKNREQMTPKSYKTNFNKKDKQL